MSMLMTPIWSVADGLWGLALDSAINSDPALQVMNELASTGLEPSPTVAGFNLCTEGRVSWILNSSASDGWTEGMLMCAYLGAF